MPVRTRAVTAPVGDVEIAPPLAAFVVVDVRAGSRARSGHAAR
ncbi:hypothetical protein [Microbacterium sp.]